MASLERGDFSILEDESPFPPPQENVPMFPWPCPPVALYVHGTLLFDGLSMIVSFKVRFGRLDVSRGVMSFPHIHAKARRGVLSSRQAAPDH